MGTGEVSLQGHVLSEPLSKANQDSARVAEKDINFIDISKIEAIGFVTHI